MSILNLLNSNLKERLQTEGIEKFLDFLGDERLEKKKERMTNLLKIANPDEALYREIMLALGYKNNKVQFLELSLILPYSEICKLKNKETIEKALLYRAGFSSSKEGLPKDFDFSLKMSKSVWDYKGTRPANFPEKRIKNISDLLFESCNRGLCSFFESVIVQNFGKEINRTVAVKSVKKFFEVFNKGNKRIVGPDRAKEIFFNIITPFFSVYFEEEKKKELSDFLYNIYIHHPTLSDNSITTTLKIQLFGEDKRQANQVVNSARRYMGLMQLHNKLVGKGEESDNS